MASQVTTGAGAQHGRDRRTGWRVSVRLAIVLGGATMLVVASTSEGPFLNAAAEARAEGALKLAANKDYGNKYKNGLLPVGDGKYSTSTAKKGEVLICEGFASRFSATRAGAQKPGNWFTSDKKQYYFNKKVIVEGNESKKGTFSNKVSGDKRNIDSNGLPNSHTVGTFPVTGAAAQYDRNPNKITEQRLSYALNTSPAYGGKPNCIGPEVGIMLSGVPIFSAVDEMGRDAGAWETQDHCEGHPQQQGKYHYHTLTRCAGDDAKSSASQQVVADVSVKTVIGFALDGFPITGPVVVPGKSILTTSDLDECHGITSEIELDGKKKTTYHYVMTEDFPYSVGCFRAAAIKPPGAKQGGQQKKPQQRPNVNEGPDDSPRPTARTGPRPQPGQTPPSGHRPPGHPGHPGDKPPPPFPLMPGHPLNPGGPPAQ